jgi:hypothetical protein
LVSRSVPKRRCALHLGSGVIIHGKIELPFKQSDESQMNVVSLQLRRNPSLRIEAFVIGTFSDSVKMR